MITDFDTISVQEAIQLGAVDPEFFSRTFFPKTARQAMPPFHRKVWAALEGPDRLLNIQMYRGSAKTSIARLCLAKRVAYGMSHTILCVGKSEAHAIRSVKWLRKQIQFNKLFSETFQLKPGSKWQDGECEIWHGVEKYSITVLAIGMTGSTRGVNVDDYRPDFILCDDILDEENTATPEQREKVQGLLYGALKESLAPATESPNAKLAVLQTPHNKEDITMQALNDPEWHSVRFGCFTDETADLPIEQQMSRWEERNPSVTLRAEKRAAIARNQLSIWLREKECKIVSKENATFRANWLNFYKLLPERMQIVMAIDPVPPPSEIQIAKGMRTKDYEAFSVVGKYKEEFYLLDYSTNRGHEPSWTVSEFFRLGLKWRPTKILVESVAYQRTLAWLLKQSMKEKGIYFVVEEYVDNRKKFDRIVDGLSGISSEGRLHIKADQVDFISQFNEYPHISHDDLIETVAKCCSVLQGISGSYATYEDLMEEESNIPRLADYRGAP